MTYLPSSFGGGGGGGAGAAWFVGDQIFAWNKADLSQFDTGNLLVFEETGAGGPSGVMTPAYVASGYKGEPVIRLNANTILGGSVLPILGAELALPKRYSIYVHIVGITTTSLSALVCPFGNAAAGTQWRGITWKRTGGGTNRDFELTTDATGMQRLRTPFAFTPSADTWNSTHEGRGGSIFRFDCLRQNGAAANDWYVRNVGRETSFNDLGSLGRPDATGGNNTSPDWDNQDMDLVGIGVLSETSGRSGDIDFLDIQIFATT